MAYSCYSQQCRSRSRDGDPTSTSLDSPCERWRQRRPQPSRAACRRSAAGHHQRCRCGRRTQVTQRKCQARSSSRRAPAAPVSAATIGGAAQSECRSDARRKHTAVAARRAACLHCRASMSPQGSGRDTYRCRGRDELQNGCKMVSVKRTESRAHAGQCCIALAIRSGNGPDGTRKGGQSPHAAAAPCRLAERAERAGGSKPLSPLRGPKRRGSNSRPGLGQVRDHAV